MDREAMKQPEALRLADMIERYNAGVHSQAIVEDYCKVASELRRLHTEVNRLTEVLRRANGTAEHFERHWYLRGDQIEELLEALESCENFCLGAQLDPSIPPHAREALKHRAGVIHAAIAKATGGKV